MAVCDKWVALKIVEFLFCIACLVAKRVSQDDEARLALLLQKLSREWSLLTSVTWDSIGGAFADAVYGGYVIITFALIVGRVFQEIPKGRRLLEGVLLGLGMLFFLILGGLELASLDSVPRNLTVNASVLGALSLAVAALFLLDLMGPRVYTATHHAQTDPISSPKPEKKVSILTQPVNSHLTHEKQNGGLPNGKQNGGLPNGKQNGYLPADRPKDLDLESGRRYEVKETDLSDPSLFDDLKKYPKLSDDEIIERDTLEKSKFGSLRSDIEGGNYVRLSDPFEPLDRLHYERELAKFNEKYFKEYLDSYDPKLTSAKWSTKVKQEYLPEPQVPVFTKVKPGRLKSLYDDRSPSYEDRRSESKSPTRIKTVPSPTLQQLEDYLRGSNRSRRSDTPLFPIEEKEKDIAETNGRASGTPSDRGYVQYTAGKWPDKREVRTPRHSPTE